MQIALKDITVRFGALLAVDGVSLSFRSGEVHAVLGENGAGKTTAMNVLFGLLRPQSGSIDIDGQPRHWSSPQDAIAARLGMVHQHFMLQHAMTVLENIVLCNEPIRRFGLVDFAAARKRLAAIASDYRIEIDLDAVVGDLSLGQRQRVEILKMLFRDADMLILDEPTAVLTPLEKDQLFEVIRAFRQSGKALAIITHKLDEVMEIADHVSVMRAGRLISSVPIAETSKDRIARDIVGGDRSPSVARQDAAPGEVVLSVRDLTIKSRGRQIGPFGFDLRAGQILGIGGVSGNGQNELVQALVGLRPPASGEIWIAGQRVDHLPVAARRAAGMSYIPEDRQTVGLALGASVSENAAIGRMAQPAFHRGPFRVLARMTAFGRELIQRYNIRVAGPAARASTMSGGNKQKLVVGRELSRKTPLVIVENPTWGVDIGAIDLIHRELIAMRDAGHAILMISTELDEVMALSDRIIVVYAGKIAGALDRAEADRGRIGRMMVSSAAALPGDAA